MSKSILKYAREEATELVEIPSKDSWESLTKYKPESASEPWELAGAALLIMSIATARYAYQFLYWTVGVLALAGYGFAAGFSALKSRFKKS